MRQPRLLHRGDAHPQHPGDVAPAEAEIGELLQERGRGGPGAQVREPAWGPTSRPVPQWTRPGVTPVETLGRHDDHC